MAKSTIPEKHDFLAQGVNSPNMLHRHARLDNRRCTGLGWTQMRKIHVFRGYRRRRVSRSPLEGMQDLVLVVSSLRVAFHAQSSLRYYVIALGHGAIKRQTRQLVFF